MLGRLYWVSIILKASLAPAKAEVGAVAKADQNKKIFYSKIKEIFSRFIRKVWPNTINMNFAFYLISSNLKTIISSEKKST